MKIAVAVSNDARKVAGHAGRARHWLVYAITDATEIPQPKRIDLESAMVFHHYEGEGPHPLDDIQAVIAQSAGDGFLRRLDKRGVEVALTAETDPAKAVADYLAECLSSPKARPIGSLICKTLDLFSKHK